MLKKIAPYQVFFPLGLLNALLGVGVWFIRDLQWISTPTLFIHSKLISGGFLWCFITGFLMTAIPKMLGSFDSTRIELATATAIMLSLMGSASVIDFRPFYLCTALLISFLIVFALRRVLKSTKPAPVFFFHVGIGMFLGLAGSWFHFRGNSFMGIHLYQVGAVLLLVLGIGTRFFSFLSGLPSLLEGTTDKRPRAAFHISALVVAGLLYLAGSGWSSAYLGLSAMGVFYLFAFWRIQRPSARPSALKHGVRVVAAMIPLSFFLIWLQPGYFVAWFHLLFIGCFSLLTLSVSTRVTLAHGAYSTDLEIQSKSLWWVIGFLLMSLVARISYGFCDEPWKDRALYFAVIAWLFAVSIWCRFFFLKIFKSGFKKNLRMRKE